MNCSNHEADDIGPHALARIVGPTDGGPFTLDEIAVAADVLARDLSYPTQLVRVGLACDLRPGALSPDDDQLRDAYGVSAGVVALARIVWETLDDAERLDVAARAVRMIRAERAVRCHG